MKMDGLQLSLPAEDSVTAADGSTQLPLRPAGRLIEPPGVLFYLATTIAIFIAIDASSRDSLSTFLLAAPIWLILCGYWAVRFARAATGRLRMPRAHWIRWFTAPLVMGLVFLVTRTDVLFDTRLALSRGAMDQMAAEVMAGGSLERGWVGLYSVGEVERLDNGLRFVIDDSGLYRHGFAYAQSGEPAESSIDNGGLWTSAWYDPLGGGWWLWTESWD
jgi:hypothetical protein